VVIRYRESGYILAVYVVLNLECWIKTENVHGFHEIPDYVAQTPRQCVEACKRKNGCVAVDYSASSLVNGHCHLLTSTNTERASKKDGITHYERIPDCNVAITSFDPGDL